MKKPFFQVGLPDNRIQCVVWHMDPDAGPGYPTRTVLPNVRLIDSPLAREFTRAGRRDTEAAFWLDDPGAIEWVETSTIEDARALAWDEAKRNRDEAEAAPFEFEGRFYDPNKENLAGAALRALMAQLAGQSIARTWTCADNTEVVLSGEQLIALGAALADRVDAIHAKGRELRALIENAATPAEAFSYTWDNDEK